MPSDNVELLQFPDSIQTRPGMYVGDMDEASVLLREAIDNSIDELYVGAEKGLHDICNKIWIEATENSYLVADNGRGIPIKESSEKGITMARLAVSHLSAGSKFKKNSMAIGMNGCFTGETLVTVSRDKLCWWDERLDQLALLRNTEIQQLYVKTSKGPRKILLGGVTNYVYETIELTFDDCQSIECTPTHKFMLIDETYKEAKDLTENDQLLCDKVNDNLIFSKHVIHKVTKHHDHRIPVYDLSIEEVHNFKLSLGPIVHNCGISCVNALSTNFTIMSRLKLHNLDELPKKLKDKVPEVITDSTYYYCDFKEGHLKDEGFREYSKDTFQGEKPSTITSFSPNPKFYRSTRARIPSSLQYVKFILEKSNHPSEIYINGKPFKDSYKGFRYNLDCTIETAEEGAKNQTLRFLISLGFQEKLEPCQVVGSVNGLDCRSGFHIKLAQTAFDKAFSKMYSDCNRTEFMGMYMGIICLCNEPEFSSQTKERMSGADGFRCTEREGKHEIEVLSKAFMKLMKDNYDDFRAHEAKILEYMKSTEKIGRKEFIKSTILIAANSSRPEAFIPNKLLDCSTTNRQEAELILCFTGDTEILDCNFNKISFEELTRRVADNEKIYTYSCDSKGSIYPSKIIWAGVTGKASKILKVTLDNGEFFKCTPEHKFLMRSGEYKEAKNLTEGESLMPLYYGYTNTYEYGGSQRRIVKCPQTKYPFRDAYQGTDENDNWVVEVLNRVKETKTELTNKTFSDCARELGYSGVRIEAYRKLRGRFEDLFSEVEFKLNSNHKVLKVETITYDTPIDVYCLRVDNELHNFPLADGIFAHNCEGAGAAGSLIKCRDPRIHAILPLRGWN